MNDYLLKKEKKKKKVSNLITPLEGFHMKPHLRKHKNLIEIKDLVVVEEELKTNLIVKQFDRYFRKLVAIMVDITESSNSTSSDCAIALNEVAKIKSMLEFKAEKDLKRNELEKMYKKLALVEGKIQNKLLEIRTNEMMNQMLNVPDYGKENGRGR